MEDSGDPYMYLHFLEEYLQAYKLIKQIKPSPIELFFFKAFLLGRMIELSLKTQLIMKGFLPKELRRKGVGGHDLIKLLKLLGFPDRYSIDHTTYQAIYNLNPYYMEKSYEYPKTTDIEVRNIAFLENFIQLTFKKIKFHLFETKKK